MQLANKSLNSSGIASTKSTTFGQKLDIEPYCMMGEAARMLGLKYHIIQRNVRRGVFPAYRVGGRLRVRVSEIVNVIEATRQGGGQ